MKNKKITLASGKLFELLWRDLPLWLLILISIIISTSYFMLIYPISFLLGDGAYFYSGDAAQHVSGWHAYIADQWRFPLLRTEILNYPDGVNIAFTDSIPLLAITLKIFKSFIAEGFHYFGWWHAFSFVLQGIAAVFIMRSVGHKSLVSILAAVFLFVTSSILLHRAGHTALMTHALILFSMANYFSVYQGRRSVDSGISAQILILLISFLIHPYFFAINSIFLVPLTIESYRENQSDFFKTILKLVLSAFIFLAILYLFGYLGHASGASGFGIYSMNLASPFCGGELLNCKIDATGGQHEGYSYLGSGMLLMIVIGLCQSHKKLLSLIKNNVIFCSLLGLLFLYSISNRIYLGDTLLFSYPMPSFLSAITDTFRASGRFFWLPFYIIVFLALLSVLNKQRRYTLVLLLLACGLQWYDLSPVRAGITTISEKESDISFKSWSILMDNVEGVVVFPPYECGNIDKAFFNPIMRIAVSNGKYITSAYTARSATPCVEKAAFIESKSRPAALYATPYSMISAGYVMLPEEIIPSNCVVKKDAVLCVHGTDPTWWEPLGFGVPYVAGAAGYRGELIGEFAPADLPSQIGRVNDSYLMNNGSEAGYLSYGPYLSLPQGTYRATIDYIAQPNTVDVETVGSWDIVAGANSHGNTQNISAGELKSTTSLVTEKVIQFQIEENAEMLPLEVRIYVKKGYVVKLSAIEIIRIQDS
jgi:hypothetical protein